MINPANLPIVWEYSPLTCSSCGLLYVPGAHGLRLYCCLVALHSALHILTVDCLKFSLTLYRVRKTYVVYRFYRNLVIIMDILKWKKNTTFFNLIKYRRLLYPAWLGPGNLTGTVREWRKGRHAATWTEKLGSLMEYHRSTEGSYPGAVAGVENSWAVNIRRKLQSVVFAHTGQYIYTVSNHTGARGRLCCPFEPHGSGDGAWGGEALWFPWVWGMRSLMSCGWFTFTEDVSALCISPQETSWILSAPSLRGVDVESIGLKCFGCLCLWQGLTRTHTSLQLLDSRPLFQPPK